MRRAAHPSRILFLCLTCLTALVIASLWANAQAAVTVILPELTILQGETAILEGRIVCPGFCSAFDITVQYDRSVLRVENAAVGEYLGAPELVTLTANGILFDFASGLVRIAASSSADAPGDSDVLFLLVVTGLNPGISPLRIIDLQVSGGGVRTVIAPSSPNT
jgi:hypothetical protein